MRKSHREQGINIFRYAVASFLPALFILISLLIVAGKIKSDIDFASLELDGLHHIDSLHVVFSNLQELRRISIEYPVPLTDQHERISKLQREVESNLEKLIANDDRLIFKTKSQIGAFSHNLGNLLQQYNNGASGKDIYLKFNELVDDILLIKLVISTKSNLVLDPSPDSYHVMNLVTREVPVIMDTVGKIEWLAAGFLTGETRHMLLHSEMDSLSRALSQIKRSEEAIIQYSSDYKFLYHQLSDLIIRESNNYVAMIDSILHDKNSSIKFSDVSKKRLQLLGECNQFYSKASNILNKLLSKRILALKDRLMYSMMALFLAFVFYAYFISRFYYINRAISSAHLEADKANEELASINKEMESTNQELLKEISERETAESKIKRKHFEQEILNSLLSFSLEHVSIDKTLKLCLDEILSIPFLPLKPAGAIFRVKEGSRELNLVFHRGMEAEVLAQCASGILFGQCLCGKVAERGETIFAESEDPEHDFRFEGMEPHGHYCIPIKSRKEVLGVITLYLEKGHCRDKSEVEFLETVAATMAGILERKKVEEALRESEKKYRETINTTSEGYWFINMEKKTLDVNESICNMLGYSREEMLGKTPMNFVDEENAEIFKEQTSKIATTTHRVYEISLRKKDGTNVPTIFYATTRRDDDGNPLGGFAFITDISELKKTEEALRQAKEAAEEANRLKDKFVSLVSHDLKNPIHRIAGYLDMIKATQTISEEGMEMIEEGKIACDDMTTLINEILNMNRIRGGILHPDHAFVHADRIAEQAVRNYATLAREKGISLKNSIPPAFRLYADERLILEVLRNLISNAIKFCNKGDKINIYIPEGEKSVIAVSDTGIGIEASRMAGLFKYDEKSSTRGTLDEGGSGIGLPLSNDIMMAHCGELYLSSAPMEGTTFYLRFPHIRPVVMIVDDDESMKNLFRVSLESMDISFIETGSGEQALNLLEHNLPHLIFIDMHLPGMSGLELLERLKNTPATGKTPVIVITADKTMEAIDNFFQFGADDFIAKPFKKEDLMSSVKNFIC